MTTITANAYIPLGFTTDDVLAELLRTQHERALIESSEARTIAPQIAQVTFRYGPGVGAGEIDDVIDRFDDAPAVTVLSVTVKR